MLTYIGLQILVGPSPPPPRPAQITPSALMQLVVMLVIFTCLIEFC